MNVRAILTAAAIVVVGCLVAYWAPVLGVLGAFLATLYSADRGWLDRRHP